MHEMYCFSDPSLYLRVNIHAWLGNPLTLSGIHVIWVIARSEGLSSFLYVIARFTLSNLHADLSLVRFTFPNIS